MIAQANFDPPTESSQVFNNEALAKQEIQPQIQQARRSQQEIALDAQKVALELAQTLGNFQFVLPLN